jgi:hypothetical protein
MTGLPKAIIRKYGVTKKAWQVYRGRRSGTRNSANQKAKREKNMTKRRSYRRYPRRVYRRARTGMAGLRRDLGIKSAAAGTIGLILAKKVIGDNSWLGLNLGVWNEPAQKIATGVVAGMAKLDNVDLISAGVKEALATAVDTYLLSGTAFGTGLKNEGETI